MTSGHVVAQSHDASGNVMGKSHTNPILDTECIKLSFLGAKLQNNSNCHCRINVLRMQCRQESVFTLGCAR